MPVSSSACAPLVVPLTAGASGTTGPTAARRVHLAGTLGLAAQGALGHGPAELVDQAGSCVGVGEHVIEGGDEVIHLRLARHEGRQELDDVDVVGGHLGQDPVAVEEGHDHHLGEHGGAQSLERPEPPARRPRLGLAELDADHETEPADVVDQVVAILECRATHRKGPGRCARRWRRCPRRQRLPVSPVPPPWPAGCVRRSSSA